VLAGRLTDSLFILPDLVKLVKHFFRNYFKAFLLCTQCAQSRGSYATLFRFVFACSFSISGCLEGLLSFASRRSVLYLTRPKFTSAFLEFSEYFFPFRLFAQFFRLGVSHF
jgi:hypothetical protein